MKLVAIFLLFSSVIDRVSASGGSYFLRSIYRDNQCATAPLEIYAIAYDSVNAAPYQSCTNIYDNTGTNILSAATIQQSSSIQNSLVQSVFSGLACSGFVSSTVPTNYALGASTCLSYQNGTFFIDSTISESRFKTTYLPQASGFGMASLVIYFNQNCANAAGSSSFGNNVAYFHVHRTDTCVTSGSKSYMLSCSSGAQTIRMTNYALGSCKGTSNVATYATASTCSAQNIAEVNMFPGTNAYASIACSSSASSSTSSNAQSQWFTQAFYTDSACSMFDTTNPISSIALGVCIVGTSGTTSMMVSVLPSTTNAVSVAQFADPLCKQVSSVKSVAINNNFCQSITIPAGSGSTTPMTIYFKSSISKLQALPPDLTSYGFQNNRYASLGTQYVYNDDTSLVCVAANPVIAFGTFSITSDCNAQVSQIGCSYGTSIPKSFLPWRAYTLDNMSLTFNGGQFIATIRCDLNPTILESILAVMRTILALSISLPIVCCICTCGIIYALVYRRRLAKPQPQPAVTELRVNPMSQPQMQHVAQSYPPPTTATIRVPPPTISQHTIVSPPPTAISSLSGLPRCASILCPTVVSCTGISCSAYHAL